MTPKLSERNSSSEEKHQNAPALSRSPLCSHTAVQPRLAAVKRAPWTCSTSETHPFAPSKGIARVNAPRAVLPLGAFERWLWGLWALCGELIMLYFWGGQKSARGSFVLDMGSPSACRELSSVTYLKKFCRWSVISALVKRCVSATACYYLSALLLFRGALITRQDRVLHKRGAQRQPGIIRDKTAD